MKNVDFKESNVGINLADPGLHYKALRSGDYLVFCFKMNWKERLRAFLTGRIWVSKIAPLDQHLQPFILTPKKSLVIQDGRKRKTKKRLESFT